ncbi:alpha/beta hydrolase [Aciduricibacillus chroicocephali]|uniref:Alpha/beta hydrolase n=1 Tax=Aciduricibacillus chroicocephali TaxID=3054939 RepID=A0ABY9KU50_9BACI|nr:alpha/beta hydrolase [Bacillaceae bacterium 44XB]
MTTILWLPGWSFDYTIFSGIQNVFPSEVNHLHVNWQGLEEKEDVSNRVQAILNQADGDVFAVGWSLGAIAALEMALKAPLRVKGLALFSPTASFVKREHYECGWDRRVVRRMQKQLTKDKQKVLDDFAAHLLMPGEETIGSLNKAVSDDSVSSLAAGLDYLSETDLRSRITDLKLPIIIFHGIEDSICPQEASLFIEEQAGRNINRITLDDTGHIPFMAEKQSVERELAKFYKGLA